MQFQPIDAVPCRQFGRYVAFWLNDMDGEVGIDLDGPASLPKGRNPMQHQSRPVVSTWIADQHQVVDPGVRIPTAEYVADPLQAQEAKALRRCRFGRAV